MAEFLGDLVILLAMVTVAAGFIFMDRARSSNLGSFAKVGALILIFGGIGTGICASYYMFHFRAAGDFDRAYPPALLQPMGMGMMGKGMGMRMMSNGGMMGSEKDAEGPANKPQMQPDAQVSPEEHKAHHPN